MELFERLPTGRHGLPAELVRRHQRARIFSATAALCARQGFAATSIAQITTTAGVSRKTFYDFFENKEHCLLAAHDELSARLFAAIDAACGSAPSPPRISAALDAALSFLAADLPATQLLTLDILALGPCGAERYHALLDALRDRLRASAERPADAQADWAMIASISARVARAASENDPKAILDLEHDFSAMLLALTTEPA